jgi:hypothetical protein
MPIYPSDLDIPPLQLRRSSASTVSNYVPAEGEPVWITDTKQLVVGDGTTAGGIAISGGGGGGTSTFTNITVTQTATIESIAFTGNAIAIGENAYAVDNPGFVGGIAIGKDSAANTNGSVAIGYQADATGSSTIALGGSASADNANALGSNSNASGLYASAVGANAVASGDFASALGSASNAAGDYALAVGGYSQAAANGSIVINAGTETTTSTNSGFYVNPIRNTTSTQVLYYDADTKEITYGEPTGGGGSAYDQELNTTDDVTFNTINITNTATVNKLAVLGAPNNTATNILYYDSTTGEISYSVAAGFVGGNPFDQSLNTTDPVVFKGMTTSKVTSAGGFPLDANGEALIVTGNTQTPAMVVSNYTAGILPAIQVRGYGQNNPGGTAASVGTAAISLEAGRGTPGTPVAVTNGGGLGVIGFGGYDGARWSSEQFSAVRFIALASENWAGNATTATNAGARWFIQSQPLGIQLDTNSRHFDILTAQSAGSVNAPPTHQLLLGQADNTMRVLISSNGATTHYGHGATNIQSINSKHEIYGVPFQDAAVFTADISGTTMTVSAVTSGILSVGQRVYGTGIAQGTFISSIGTTNGGTGTYTVNVSQTVASMTMNSGADNTTLNGSDTFTFISGRKNGTGGRRNSLKTGDSIGRILFNGQTANNQSGSGGRAAQIRVNALENFSGSARGAAMTFTTINSGTTSEQTRLSLSNVSNTHFSDSHTFNDSGNTRNYATFAPNTVRLDAGSDGFIVNSINNFLQIHSYEDRTDIGANNSVIAQFRENDIRFSATSGDIQTAYFSTGTCVIGGTNLEVANAQISAPGGSNLAISLYGDGTNGVKMYSGGVQVADFTTSSIALDSFQTNIYNGGQNYATFQPSFISLTNEMAVVIESDNPQIRNFAGTNIASFSTNTTQIKCDEFNVTAQDNTSLITVANYGTRINNGTLYIGNPEVDGTIRTSLAGDDLTIQSNDGTTGGKIFLQESGGIQLYALGTEIVNISTTTFNISTGVALQYDRTYGCFHKMANITAAAADTVYEFNWYADTTAHVGNQGVTVTSGDPTRINIDAAGNYNVFAELQAKNTDNAERTAWIWLAKNGSDLAETRIKVVLLKEWQQLITKQWMVDGIAAGDYIEMRFAVSNTSGISLEYEAAQTTPFNMPAQASATITVSPVGA